MAVTATVSVQGRNRGSAYGTITTSGTYATGGYAVTPAMFGFSGLQQLDVNSDSGFVFEYVPTTQGNFAAGGKVKAFWSSAAGTALSEITAATALATVASFEADGY